MEPLRLDPADPLASVLAWLAAMVRALGLDPKERVPLDRAAAASVRRVLAELSRRLRDAICAKAAKLAARLAASLGAKTAGGGAAPPRASSTRVPAPAGRMVALVGARRPRDAVRPESRDDVQVEPQPAVRRASSDLLDPAEAAALKRRTRAVLLALHDPSALIERLARRLARAGRAAGRDRFGPPPRSLSVARRSRAIAPEPRPPNQAAFRLSA